MQYCFLYAYISSDQKTLVVVEVIKDSNTNDTLS